jgi:thiamine biosynthesis lipoprotein
MEINLGSIGKGYALDRCAQLLRQAGVHDFLLHGGQSSVLGGGSQGGEKGESSAVAETPASADAQPMQPGTTASAPQGWRVGVRDPLRPRRRLGEIRLHNRALATSGSGVQFFVHNGQRYGHILDPRSGWPAQGVLSTTVVAPSAADADALSTAFYVMGPQRAAAYCRVHPQVGCVMSCPGERSGALELHIFGLGEGDWIPVRTAS